jgi:hypothetical protein
MKRNHHYEPQKSVIFVGVKLTLYQGLYEVVVRNGALCGAVLDMLHHHVVVSNINNPNSINPIDIDGMIGEESGEPYVKVKNRYLYFPFCAIEIKYARVSVYLLVWLSRPSLLDSLFGRPGNLD